MKHLVKGISVLALFSGGCGNHADLPKTLFELAGVKLSADLASSTLVLVDYQNEYLDGDLPLYRINETVFETKKVLQMARNAGIPIIHVVHNGGSKGGLFDLSSHRGQIIDSLKPEIGEVVVQKTFPNSFAGTELEMVIASKAKSKNLIIVGLMSHMCLRATVGAAAEFGYQVTVIANTTTTRDLKDANDTTVSASDVTRASLAAIKDRFALVLNTPEELLSQKTEETH